MRPLLLALCGAVAVLELRAGKPAVRFDLPYTSERGFYVVTVEPLRCLVVSCSTPAPDGLHKRTVVP